MVALALRQQRGRQPMEAVWAARELVSPFAYSLLMAQEAQAMRYNVELMSQVHGADATYRVKRADSKRTLVAENAKYARTVLEEFAAISRPKYKVRDAMLFGTFIDFFMLLRIPIGNTLTRALIRHGGPEQLRFLFCVATFDSDHNGYIDDKEWAQYEKVGDALIADSVAMCANMGIVGALLLVTLALVVHVVVAVEVVLLAAPNASGLVVRVRG